MSTRLHDGTLAATLHLDGQGGVRYKRHGAQASHAVRAEACTADAHAELQRACDYAEPLFALNGAVTLDASVPVAATYRVNFGEGPDRLVVNHVETEDAAQCAARLCAHNQDACPGSACKLTADRACVPK